MKAMLAQMGVRIDGPLTDFETAATAARIDIKNTAAVLVTADLPGFAKPGQRIDINVSAIGKATSLRGGSLIMTAMRGVDGEIYALAQGALTTTGIDANQQDLKCLLAFLLLHVFRVARLSSVLLILRSKLQKT